MGWPAQRAPPETDVEGKPGKAAASEEASVPGRRPRPARASDASGCERRERTQCKSRNVRIQRIVFGNANGYNTAGESWTSMSNCFVSHEK
jgi:hypothetical protein